MNENKKRMQRRLFGMLAFLIALVVGFSIYSGYVYMFNHTERTFRVGEQNDDFTVTIAPRTGQTDSWPKIIDENGTDVDYQGTIYDVTVNNIGNYVISNWNLSIGIQKDCYLNNAWCGKFEIHQNVSGKKNVQTVDLRNYSIDDLGLSYKVANPDLLIPLGKGDTLIYYPDQVSDEYPISCQGAATISEVVFGMIFYNQGTEPILFDDYNMVYYLEKKYTQGVAFYILCGCSMIWGVFLIVFATMAYNMKKANLRFKQDERIIRQSIGVFTQFFEAKDNYTNGHSQRVAKYARLIAEKLDFSEDDQRQIYYIALLHDCGKCYIPDEILKKPGKLTDDEYEVIKSHTQKGAEMLEDFTAIEHIKDGVLYHHERFDGKGYPAGLSGENIPLISRIICIADSFDAMNSRRCYRDMLTKDYIVSELQANSGKQFDPQIVQVFLGLIKEGKIEFSNEI